MHEKILFEAQNELSSTWTSVQNKPHFNPIKTNIKSNGSLNSSEIHLLYIIYYFIAFSA